jgi:hypothetical protein
MVVRGIPQHVISKTLGVHRNTVCNDVRYLIDRHRKEISDINVHETLGDAAAKFDEIFKYAMQEYSNSNGPRERAAFLEKALSAMDKKTKLLVDTGVLPKAAQEITGKMVIGGLDMSRASLEELRTLRSRMVSQLEQTSPENRISKVLSEN